MFNKTKGFSQIFVLIFMSVLALSLPVVTHLAQHSQDERSSAASDESNNSSTKINFKFAFKGVKPFYIQDGNSYNCFDSLSDLELQVFNKTSNSYESDLEAGFNPINNEVNSDGDQVFQTSDIILNPDIFNNLDNSNNILIKGPFHLIAKLCSDNQNTKNNDSVCNINLKNGHNYNFSNYPLLPGNLNNDTIVNSLDYSLLKSELNSDSEVYCGRDSDLNMDGIVNSIDSNLLKNNLSKQEDATFITPSDTESDTDVTPEISNSPTSEPTNTPTATPTDTSKTTPTPTLALTPTPTTTISVPTPTVTPTIAITSNTGLRVAVMADIHNNTTGLKRMMQKAKDHGSSIVVLAGDLSEDGKKNELVAVKNTADSSGIKYAAIPGNHDSRKSYFDDVFGKKYQAIKFDDYKVKLILINNSYFKGLGSSQIKWLQNEMPECKKITCMIIMHMPLNHPTSNMVWGKYKNSSVNKKDAAWLKKMIVNNNIKQIVVGHIHQVKNYNLEGFTTQIVSPIKGSKPVYGEFLFNNGQITTSIVSDSTN